MSDSVRPHRRQPTRLLRPWDSPGKNTRVGCHFLLQCMKRKSQSEVVQSGPTQRSHGRQPSRLLRRWDFPGKSTGVGCHCLLRYLAWRHGNPLQNSCLGNPWTEEPGRRQSIVSQRIRHNWSNLVWVFIYICHTPWSWYPSSWTNPGHGSESTKF